MGAVGRSLRLLEVLADQGDSVGVIELSETMGLPASTLHRLLAELAEHGLVAQDPVSRRYRLGSGVLRLAQSFLHSNPLMQVAQPYLASLRSEVQETVFLTTLVGDDAVCTATAESLRPLQFYMRLGQRMPFHAAASARAILAYRSSAEIERLLGREAMLRYTEATPTRVPEVLSDLARVRALGYAVCAEEMEVGITAISAPVRDATGSVYSSVTIVAPTERLRDQRESTIARAVIRTADTISRALGFLPDRMSPNSAFGPVLVGS